MKYHPLCLCCRSVDVHGTKNFDPQKEQVWVHEPPRLESTKVPHGSPKASPKSRNKKEDSLKTNSTGSRTSPKTTPEKSNEKKDSPKSKSPIDSRTYTLSRGKSPSRSNLDNLPVVNSENDHVKEHKLEESSLKRSKSKKDDKTEKSSEKRTETPIKEKPNSMQIPGEASLSQGIVSDSKGVPRSSQDPQKLDDSYPKWARKSNTVPDPVYKNVRVAGIYQKPERETLPFEIPKSSSTAEPDTPVSLSISPAVPQSSSVIYSDVNVPKSASGTSITATSTVNTKGNTKSQSTVDTKNTILPSSAVTCVQSFVIPTTADTVKRTLDTKTSTVYQTSPADSPPLISKNPVATLIISPSSPNPSPKVSSKPHESSNTHSPNSPSTVSPSNQKPAPKTIEALPASSQSTFSSSLVYPVCAVPTTPKPQQNSNDSKSAEPVMYVFSIPDGQQYGIQDMKSPRNSQPFVYKCPENSKFSPTDPQQVRIISLDGSAVAELDDATKQKQLRYISVVPIGNVADLNRDQRARENSYAPKKLNDTRSKSTGNLVSVIQIGDKEVPKQKEREKSVSLVDLRPQDHTAIVDSVESTNGEASHAVEELEYPPQSIAAPKEMPIKMGPQKQDPQKQRTDMIHKQKLSETKTHNHKNETENTPESDEETETEILLIHRLPGEKLGMGLSVESSGGDTDPVKGVFVDSVTPGGAADKATGGTRGVCIGDQILAINGTPLADVSYTETLTFFKEIPLRLILTVKRKLIKPFAIEEDDDKNTKLGQQSYNSSNNHSLFSVDSFDEDEYEELDFGMEEVPEGYEVKHIEFERNPSDSLGISVVPSYGSTQGYYQVRQFA